MGDYQTKVIIKGAKRRFWRDSYYKLMEASWTQLFCIFFSVYIVINLFFGLLFYITPESYSGGQDYVKAFSFSVQTFTTIGYGVLHPLNKMGNILVMIESTIGLIFTAISTGLVFSKIARPIAKIRFSKNLLIHDIDGVRTLVCRIGNTRSNEITEATVYMTALIDHKTKEGQVYRNIRDLHLTRQASPFFRLTWTIQHPIDENSPLYNNESFENLRSIIISMRGFDSTYSNKVSDRMEYVPSDILVDKYFEDVIIDVDDETVMMDYSKFDQVRD